MKSQLTGMDLLINAVKSTYLRDKVSKSWTKCHDRICYELLLGADKSMKIKSLVAEVEAIYNLKKKTTEKADLKPVEPFKTKEEG